MIVLSSVDCETTAIFCHWVVGGWCCIGRRPVGWMSLLILTLAVLFLSIVRTSSGECYGMCGACVRRYGCMTPAWGKCCTQFYQHNGRKRNNVADDIEDGKGQTPDHMQPMSAAARLMKNPPVTPLKRRVRRKRSKNSEVTWWYIRCEGCLVTGYIFTDLLLPIRCSITVID